MLKAVLLRPSSCAVEWKCQFVSCDSPQFILQMSSEVFTACSVNASVLMKLNFVFFIQIFHHWLIRKSFLSLLIMSIFIPRLQKLVAINKGKDVRKNCQVGLHCVQTARMNGIISCSLCVYFCNWIRSGTTNHENLKSNKQTKAQDFGKHWKKANISLFASTWGSLSGWGSEAKIKAPVHSVHPVLVNFVHVKLFIFMCCFIHSCFQFV